MRQIKCRFKEMYMTWLTFSFVFGTMQKMAETCVPVSHMSTSALKWPLQRENLLKDLHLKPSQSKLYLFT
jgi:hypothetical protein